MELLAQLQRPLYRSLIGLARASYGTVQDPRPAYALMLQVLLQADTAKEQELLQGLWQEKLRLAPDCATCGSPCGRTADFDGSCFSGIEPEVLQGKQQLFANLHRLARQLQAVERNGGTIERELPFLADVLFCLGEDWTAEELQPMCRELLGMLE